MLNMKSIARPPIIASAKSVKLVITIAFETISRYESYGRSVLLSKTSTLPIVKSVKNI